MENFYVFSVECSSDSSSNISITYIYFFIQFSHTKLLEKAFSLRKERRKTKIIVWRREEKSLETFLKLLQKDRK